MGHCRGRVSGCAEKKPAPAAYLTNAALNIRLRPGSEFDRFDSVTFDEEGQMALKDVIETLGDAVGDLTSLSVETYTGTITAEIRGADGAAAINWDALIKEAQKDAGGTVSLKLASRFRFDGDATLFIAEGELPADLREAHDAAVAAGQAVRSDLMELLQDSIKKLV